MRRNPSAARASSKPIASPLHAAAGVFLRWRAHRAFRRGFRCGRRIVHGHRRRERFGKVDVGGHPVGTQRRIRGVGRSGRRADPGGVPRLACEHRHGRSVLELPVQGERALEPAASRPPGERRGAVGGASSLPRRRVRGAGGRARCSDSGGRRKPFGWSAAATRAGSRLAPRYACVRVRRGHVERRCGERASHRRGRP